MCGICAYIGYDPCFDIAYEGIRMLLNRGFDASGVCGIDSKGKFISHKFANRRSFGNSLYEIGILEGESKNHIGRNEIFSIDILKSYRDKYQDVSLACFHSRWSTHGGKTDRNAHPHFDWTGKFAIVHNGIIENYEDIKKELISKGIEFKSETDSEVIVNLISFLYNGNVEDAMERALDKLQGTWGLVLLSMETPDKLYCARHGSPLLIGFGNGFIMVASEQIGFSKYVNKYICLDDNDIVVLEKKAGSVEFVKKHEYEMRRVCVEGCLTNPNPFEHWTLKEIHEQYDSSWRAMGLGGRIVGNKVKLGGLEPYVDELKGIDNLVVLGCGTSFYAGLHCANVLKNISGFSTVGVFDGGEFGIADVPKNGKTALLFLSQSGETKDLFKGIDIAKDNNLFMIGVINVVDSLIAREVNCGVYLNAGREVGVASTKAFTSQVIVLYLISVWFAQVREINVNKRVKIIEGLRRLPMDIKNTIKICEGATKEVAGYLLNWGNLFVLGKGICESIAKEGSLKIKEIGYVHAEGYSSSALKHGPLSLIEVGTPVIVINPEDEHYMTNKGVVEEVIARGAQVFVLVNNNTGTNTKIKYIQLPKNDTFRGLLSVIPLQFIAYHVAILKGTNPDYPKNLAKVITV